MTAAEYKTVRQRLGTQAEVAARLGVARSTVAHREGGGMPITTEATLAILALPKKRARAKRPNNRTERRSSASLKPPKTL